MPAPPEPDLQGEVYIGDTAAIGGSVIINYPYIQHPQSIVAARDAAMAWLNPSKWNSSIYDSAIEIHSSGTGQWLLHHQEFVKWRELMNSALWLNGPPGCGKTILSAGIIDHVTNKVNSRARDSIGLAYFFFDFKHPDQQTVHGCLASLTSQLWRSLGSSQKLDAYFSTRHERDSYASHPSTKELQLVLLETLALFDEVYLIIDALDECARDERDRLLSLLRALRQQSQESRDTNLHLLMTSRRDTDIENAFAGLPTITISVNDPSILDDIMAYIERWLDENRRAARWPEQLKREIMGSVISRSGGMFRWVRSILDQLNNCRTAGQIRHSLASLPQSIHETYSRILLEIDYEDRNVAQTVLRWLTSSMEPMMLTALAEATVLRPGSDPAFDPDDRFFDPRDVCKILPSLTTLSGHHGDSVRGGDIDNVQVLLVHWSVKEFLVSDEIRRTPAAEFAIEPLTTEKFLAESCLEYILYYSNSENKCRSIGDFTQFPLLKYACKYWTEHTRRWARLAGDTSNNLGNRNISDLAQSFFSRGEVLSQWLLVFDQEDPSKEAFSTPRSATSPLYYASSTGILKSVTHLLEQGADVSAANFQGRQPLHAATAYGHVAIANELLIRGAKTTVKDSDKNMPLLTAAFSEQTELTDLLLQYTSRHLICQVDESGSSILHDLARRSSGVVFAQFLQPHVGVKSTDHAPILDRQEIDVVNSQLNINLKDATGCTLLHRAVEAGNIPVMSLLVKKGADVDPGDNKGERPLHFAVQYDQEIAREWLIDNGADLSIRNAEGKTATELAWAKKSLNWDAYEFDQRSDRKMTYGTQADCCILKKVGHCDGPDIIFRKTYDLLKAGDEERYIIVRSLLRENQILQRLDHPFIVSYLGYEERRDQKAILYLEYCESGDLQRMHIKPPERQRSLDEGDEGDEGLRSTLIVSPPPEQEILPLGESDIWTLCYQLFAALAYLHYGVSITRQNTCRFERHWDPVVHRDIKPANVVLTFQPHGERVAKLCDLGIARQFVNVHQTKAIYRGTDEYSPPEIFDTSLEERDREWTSKGDVYSLGKTIDRLYKDFTPQGPLKEILKDCQEKKPAMRPNSLDILEKAHRHVKSPLPSLEYELGHHQGGFVLQAFLKIAEGLDIYAPFRTEITKKQRKALLGRLKLLITDGARDKFRKTSRSLHLAVLLDEEELLNQLLSHGQNPDEPWPNSGWTPLHLAVQEGKQNFVQDLLKYEASDRVKDRRGFFPLEYAMEPSLTKVLLNSSQKDTTRSFQTDLSQAPLLGTMAALEIKDARLKDTVKTTFSGRFGGN